MGCLTMIVATTKTRVSRLQMRAIHLPLPYPNPLAKDLLSLGMNPNPKELHASQKAPPRST